MKNYIKNFSQFQRINEQEGSLGIDAEALSSIASGDIGEGVFFGKDNWWLTKSTKEIESLMKAVFGDDNIDEYKLAAIHGGDEMEIISNDGLQGSCGGKTYPLKSAQDGKVKIIDAGNNTLDNEDYEKNQMEHAQKEGIPLNDADAVVITFEDDTKIVHIFPNNGGWGDRVITLGLASSLKK
jgi:hypothetical protein